MIFKLQYTQKIIIICKIGGGQIDKVQKFRFSVCLLFKVAYNSGMFDNSQLLIMQYFFSNDLWKFSERLVNTKEEMTKFEWSCAANFEVIRYLV